MTRAPANGKTAPKKTRCAIYTRKSSEEGLDQEFNSLDAQRESAEAYIASQKSEGWVCLPDQYDDGGFSGGDIKRPALEQLLLDIEAERVDCVVVYKVDRLSRSLIDFARIMGTFEKHNVSFVSVTQQFNTTNSMGRLTLNVLLSFAQFEREIIGERIRDKIAAQRRKGKWTGGSPILGYDVDRSSPSPKLVVNAEEAARVRDIFTLYLKAGSLLQAADELERRGWQNKTYRTKLGTTHQGKPFDKWSLYSLLINPLYVGKVKYCGEIHAGEQQPIIAPDLFEKVQTLLKYNGRTGGIEARNKYGALLRGLLYCKACSRAMVHTFTSGGKGRGHYRYYTCTQAIKRGWKKCPSKSLPAAEIERVVIEQVRCIGKDPDFLGEILGQAHRQTDADLKARRMEHSNLAHELARHHDEVRRLAAGTATSETAARLADLHDRIQKAERRTTQLKVEIQELERERVGKEDVAAAMADFDGVWNALSPKEQARVLKLLVARVEYDAKEGTVAVTFHVSGIKALAEKGMEDAA